MRGALLGLIALLAPGLAFGQSVRVIDPSTGQSVFSSANPAKVSSVGTGASADQVQGNVAAAAADSGNPVKIGAVYAASMPTVADGQRANLLTDSRGRLIVSSQPPDTSAAGWNVTNADAIAASSAAVAQQELGFNLVFNGTSFDRMRGDTNGTVMQPALSATFWQYAAASGGIVSSTADVAVKAAAGASVRNYVCTIDISHDVLSAVSEIVIKDNVTVIWRGKLQTAAADIAGGAGKLTFNPCLRGSANVAVNVAMITSVTGGVFVNLTGYTGS